jgi:GNAT superfamily N-acetyltransferase
VFQHEFARRVGPLLESGQMTVWIAESDGEIIANMFVEQIVKVPKPSKLDDRFGYVTNVHARETYRNQGIGSELLKRLQAWALEQDMEFLVVWPSERSVPFYQRAGFIGRDALEFEVRPYVG